MTVIKCKYVHEESHKRPHCRQLFGLLRLLLEHDHRVGDDAANGDEDANNGLVANRAPRHDPAQGDDGARLQMADDGARDGAGLGDNEELRDVDERGEGTRLERATVSNDEFSLDSG